MRSFRAMAAAAFFAACTCFAADVDGKWAGTINGGRGPINMSFDLKTEGDKLTGTAVGPQGPVPVSAGLYQDGKATFQLRYRVYDRDVVFNYTGVPSGDEMKMTLSFGIMEPTYFSVTRVKEEKPESKEKAPEAKPER